MKDYTSFVLAAYLVAAVVVAGLVLWVGADNLRQRRELDRLAAMGIRRRSDETDDQDRPDR
jgi:heme exporter protein D